MSDRALTLLLRCSSAYQLLNGLAYLEYLKKQGTDAKLIVCYKEYWAKATLAPHYAAYLANHDIQSVSPDEFNIVESALKRQRRHYVKIAINEGIQMPLSRRRVLEIDDGLGAYRSSTDKLRSLLREMHLAKLSGAKVFRMGLGIIAKGIASSVFSAEHFGLFVKKSPLEENAEYISCVRQVIERLRAERNSTQVNFYGARRVVLFLTQPVVALGWLDRKEYELMVELVEQWALDEKDACLILKKHPADDFDYAGLNCLDFGGMAEELFLEDEVIAAVSISSTSIIMASAVFNCPSYRLVGPRSLKLEHNLNELFERHTGTLNIASLTTQHNHSSN